MKRVTPEEVAGIRRLLSERPLGGLRPVEIPRAVLDRLAQALFDLAELQETTAALLGAMPLDMTTCTKCRGNILATKVCRFEPPFAGSWFACDEHATPGAMDMCTAPHVRRLRALVG